jgi:hypothetical protein
MTAPDPKNPGQYTRNPFPGNMIPQSDLNTGMVGYGKAVSPQPMFPINPSGVNAVDTAPIVMPQGEGHIRIGENLDSGNSLRAHYTGVTQL